MGWKVLIWRLLQGVFFLLMANSIVLAVLTPSAAMLGVAAVALICGLASIWGFQFLIKEEV